MYTMDLQTIQSAFVTLQAAVTFELVHARQARLALRFIAQHPDLVSDSLVRQFFPVCAFVLCTTWVDG